MSRNQGTDNHGNHGGARLPVLQGAQRPTSDTPLKPHVPGRRSTSPLRSQRPLFRRTVLSTTSTSADGNDAISPDLTAGKENSVDAIATFCRTSSRPERSDPARLRQRGPNGATSTAPRFYGRDVISALHHLGFSNSLKVTLRPREVGSTSLEILGKLFCSAFRRVLLAYPAFIVDHGVEPSTYGRQWPAAKFRDPPLPLEAFVKFLFTHTADVDVMGAFVVLAWMDKLGRRAEAKAASLLASLGPDALVSISGPTYEGYRHRHHLLKGSSTMAVPVSGSCIDTRFSLRYLAAAFLISQNLHTDYNFCVSHLMKRLNPAYTMAGCVRPDFCPFDSNSLGELQWNIATEFNFAMMVHGDELISVLSIHMSFDELASFGTAAGVI
jgi:hypothetical protein